MRNRNNRLEALRTVLSNKKTSSQESILRELARQGFNVTQATLSRDLRKLHAAKVVSPAGYQYILPDHPLYRRTTEKDKHQTPLHNTGFISINFSGNLAVIHTRPGYAGVLSSEIDSRNFSCVLGTVAGDDTILVVLAEGTPLTEVTDNLSEILPVIKSLIL